MSIIRSYVIVTQTEIPQTGLTLSDFNVNVYSARKSDANITQLVTDANMSFEVDGGIYGYYYSTSVDYTLYDYLITVEYVGALSYDANTWYNFNADIDTSEIDTDLTFLKDIEGGRWRMIGNQMIFYESDNVTEVARFDLKDSDGNATMTDVFERVRV